MLSMFLYFLSILFAFDLSSLIESVSNTLPEQLSNIKKKKKEKKKHLNKKDDVLEKEKETTVAKNNSEFFTKIKKQINPYIAIILGKTARKNNKIVYNSYPKDIIGSAFLIDPKEGYLVTSSDITDKGKEFEILLSDKKNNIKKYSVELFETYYEGFSFLKIKNHKAMPLKPLKFIDYDKICSGQSFYLIHKTLIHPAFLLVDIRDKYVSCGSYLYGAIQELSNSMFSGGILIDSKKRVVGLMSNFARNISNLSVFIPSDILKNEYNRYKNDGEYADFQIKINNYSLSNPPHKGIIVEKTKNEKIHKGDIITKINQHDIYSVAEFNYRERLLDVNKKHHLKIWRDGKEINLMLKPSTVSVHKDKFSITEKEKEIQQESDFDKKFKIRRGVLEGGIFKIENNKIKVVNLSPILSQIFQENDQIIAVNSRYIDSKEELIECLGEKKSLATIEIKRDDFMKKIYIKSFKNHPLLCNLIIGGDDKKIFVLEEDESIEYSNDSSDLQKGDRIKTNNLIDFDFFKDLENEDQKIHLNVLRNKKEKKICIVNSKYRKYNKSRFNWRNEY